MEGDISWRLCGLALVPSHEKVSARQRRPRRAICSFRISAWFIHRGRNDILRFWLGWWGTQGPPFIECDYGWEADKRCEMQLSAVTIRGAIQTTALRQTKVWNAAGTTDLMLHFLTMQSQWLEALVMPWWSFMRHTGDDKHTRFCIQCWTRSIEYNSIIKRNIRYMEDTSTVIRKNVQYSQNAKLYTVRNVKDAVELATQIFNQGAGAAVWMQEYGATTGSVWVLFYWSSTCNVYSVPIKRHRVSAFVFGGWCQQEAVTHNCNSCCEFTIPAGKLQIYL